MARARSGSIIIGTGAQGFQGDQGNQGHQGFQGEQGEKGDKGDAPIKGIDYDDGADGKDPVIIIGDITTVASNEQADATVVADGVDADGKPKFKLNLWLPKGVDGEGAGDMLKSVYDPQNKATDVFGYIDEKVGNMAPYKWQYNELTDSLDLIKTI